MNQSPKMGHATLKALGLGLGLGLTLAFILGTTESWSLGAALGAGVAALAFVVLRRKARLCQVVGRDLLETLETRKEEPLWHGAAVRQGQSLAMDGYLVITRQRVLFAAMAGGGRVERLELPREELIRAQGEKGRLVLTFPEEQDYTFDTHDLPGALAALEPAH